jgi:hypothetical protein
VDFKGIGYESLDWTGFIWLRIGTIRRLDLAVDMKIILKLILGN